MLPSVIRNLAEWTGRLLAEEWCRENQRQRQEAAGSAQHSTEFEDGLAKLSPPAIEGGQECPADKKTVP